jgi:hypothetical protein
MCGDDELYLANEDQTQCPVSKVHISNLKIHSKAKQMHVMQMPIA